MPLDDAYYLTDFERVLAEVQSLYGFLLDDAERRHIAAIQALPTPPRMLYARLVNRRGPCFRVAKLDYPELAPVEAAVEALLDAGLLEPCPAEPATISGCFTHDELKAALKPHGAPASGRRPELLAWLAGWPGAAGWAEAHLARHPVVRIPTRDPWPFLRFLFFGALRDNLADFVIRELGHLVTEAVAPAALAPRFGSRAEAVDEYRLASLYVAFRALRETQPAVATLAWWRDQAIGRVDLAGGTAWFDRLVDRLGRRLEREGEAEAATALYRTSPSAPARERLVRLLLKAGATAEAEALLAAMLQNPCHDEEAYAARHLKARLDRKPRTSEARAKQNTGASLVLDYETGRVEQAVLAHYRAQDWQGVHSENWLWSAVFGLLFWDVIFDPAYGTFHSPLQYAPSDLHEPQFYHRRRDRLEERLALLHDADAAVGLAHGHYAAKQGIANPFVFWAEDVPALAETMLRRVAPHSLGAALRHYAQDIARRRSGLPDLFLWRDDAYRFIEIKAEGDQLAPHQYEWLRVLAEAGIEVAIEQVRRPAPPTASRRVARRPPAPGQPVPAAAPPHPASPPVR